MILLKARKMQILDDTLHQESALQQTSLDLYSSRNQHLREPVRWVMNFHVCKANYDMKNTSVESGSDSKAGQSC